MNGTRALLGIVLLGFLGLTAVAVAQHGYIGFFELALANSATRLMAADLVISLALISVWMVRDARARGGGLIPFLLITATFGAAGPLLYLLRRPLSTEE